MKRAIPIVLIVVAAIAAGWIARDRGWFRAGYAPTPLADDQIILEEPLPGQVITSPVTIRGRARGNWFFEASFPLELTDSEGNVVVSSFVMTASEWMTTDFVPFETTLSFVKPSVPPGTENRGFLILHKDNPSGLPEHDDSRRIPILFE